MTLLGRLIGTEGPKIAVHQFLAGLAETARGNISQAGFSNYLGLTPGEEAALAQLVSDVIGGTLTRAEVHDVLLLAEVGTPGYDEAGVTTRLGL